ncbi:MetQ/NlpA family ABC transporter substrate-binding protein [Virgibacillus sp. W0430]|uniref:MetQ/NlpA family ABC transporter substrate-binding protein n=1 Tax=Virgibacillus sp. W0430 TaxID=3391580 RepID=UPI003F45BE04
MRKTAFILSIILLIGLLAACGSDNEESSTLSEDKLVIGTTSGPQEQILEVAKEVAAEEGLEIELKVFSDYILPNTALAEGELDVNCYQHEPFLAAFNEDHGTDLTTVGKTILNPMGVYSEKYDSFDAIPEGALFGLPNDPTNGARALFILEEAGYITLADDNKENATIHDIKENPKNLEFIELEASQIPKQLPELDAAAINTNYALESGLVPTDDSIILESTDSPYVNYIVTRTENKDDPVVEKLVNAYQSDKVKQFIEEEFQGSMIPSWD